MWHWNVNTQNLLAIFTESTYSVLDFGLYEPFDPIINLLNLIEVLEQLLKIEVIIFPSRHQVRYALIALLKTLNTLLDSVVGFCITHFVIEIVKRNSG